MKHIIRRPVLPSILLGLLVFGVLFMTMFQKGIADGKQQVQALYDNTRIMFQILPGEQSGNELALGLHKGELIGQMDEVVETYGMIRCGGYIRQPETEQAAIDIVGTANTDFFAQENLLAIQFFEDYGKENFADFDPYNIPCIVEETLLKNLELEGGQEMIVAPIPAHTWSDRADAPGITFHVIGTYVNHSYNLDWYGMIVPERVYLTDVSLPHLICYSEMMYDCFYRQFVFRLDPAYNRQHEEVKEKVEDLIGKPQRYSVGVNAKALTSAVRPLERKIAIQELLVMPLAVLLCAAAAVVALLLGLSYRREIFLRLMWGEKRLGILARLLCSVVLHLALCSGLSAVGVYLLAGAQWLGAAGKYLLLMNGLCLGAAFIPLAYFSLKNLVKLYQAGEG